MAFRSGQKVVCVDDVVDPGLMWNGPALVRGEVYTVRDYVPSHYGRDEPCIRLYEIVRAIDTCGFRASRFRPVAEPKTDISIFTKILDGVRSKEPASS